MDSLLARACSMLVWGGVLTAQAATTAEHPASRLEGVAFTHHDWDLACDNTRTCRAAGYQADAEELPVSLLLTRAAGPGTPVQARVALGSYGDEAEAVSAPARGAGRLKLRVNGKALGAMTWLDAQDSFSFNRAQMQAVLHALPRPNARIEFSHGHNVWRLSDRGAAAVLLKMDEFQGRIGTPGALARPGNRSEDLAFPPVLMPVVKAARVPEQPKGRTAEQVLGLSPKAQAALREALLKDVEDAEALSPESEEGQLRFEPLGGGKWLVGTLCWSGAYNRGSCVWVMNERPPHRPELVTDSASEFGNGMISASHKGRGLGDCWSHDEWTWDGHAFVLTSQSSTGQCKLVTPGGAWDLPTLVTRVVQP